MSAVPTEIDLHEAPRSPSGEGRLPTAALVYYVVTCCVGVATSISLQPEFVPRLLVLGMMIATAFGLVLMLPYFAYVLAVVCLAGVGWLFWSLYSTSSKLPFPGVSGPFAPANGAPAARV